MKIQTKNKIKDPIGRARGPKHAQEILQCKGESPCI